MSGHSSAQDQDGALSRRIALLMRVGTVVSALLLSGGVILGAAGAGPVGTTLLLAGCATLVALPVARLVLMADHFVHTGDKLFLWTGLLVLALVIAGATVGLLLTRPF